MEALWAGAVPEGSAGVQTVYVEGVANLLGGRAVGSAEDMARLREILVALEAKQRLVEPAREIAYALAVLCPSRGLQHVKCFADNFQKTRIFFTRHRSVSQNTCSGAYSSKVRTILSMLIAAPCL